METSIVQWLMYDDKLKGYAEKSKKIRDEKDKVSHSILEHVTIPDDVSKKDLPQYFIGSMNTKVLCHRSTTYESLNYKFLKTCLQDYFQDKHGEPSVITDDILQHIRSKRKKDTKIILKRDTINPIKPIKPETHETDHS